MLTVVEVEVKAMVKSSLCLINKSSCHEEVLRSGGIAASFLASALYGGE
jgi:hypothetical protein